jgi:hypothetical protein
MGVDVKDLCNHNKWKEIISAYRKGDTRIFFMFVYHYKT